MMERSENRSGSCKKPHWYSSGWWCGDSSPNKPSLNLVLKNLARTKSTNRRAGGGEGNPLRRCCGDHADGHTAPHGPKHGNGRFLLQKASTTISFSFSFLDPKLLLLPAPQAPTNVLNGSKQHLTLGHAHPGLEKPPWAATRTHGAAGARAASPPRHLADAVPGEGQLRGLPRNHALLQPASRFQPV